MSKIQRTTSVLAATYFILLSGLYVLVAIGSLFRPVNAASNTLWVGVVSVTLAAIWTSYRIQPTGRTLLAWMGVFGTAAAFLAISSGQWSAVLWTLSVLAAAATSGHTLLRLFSALTAASRLELAVVGTSLGLGVLSLGTLALGLAGFLTPTALALGVGGLLALQWRSLRSAIAVVRRFRWADSLNPGAVDAGLVTTQVFLALLAFVWALTPELQYDALNYQLAVPKAYLDAGRIVDLPHFWHSYLAHLTNMNYTLAMGVGGQTAAKLLAWSIAVLASVAAYCVGCRIASPRAGLLASALFTSTPMCFWIAATTYVDLAATLFLTTAVLATLVSWRSGCPGWVYAAVALAACGVGTKMNVLFGLPVLGGLALWRMTSAPMSHRRAVANCAILFSLFSLPWYLLVFAQTGNPLFPMLNGLFRSSKWPPGFVVEANFDTFGVGTSAVELLRLPLSWILATARFSEPIPAGALGAALSLFPASILLIRMYSAEARLLVMICAAYLAFWFLTAQYGRYAVPILPLVTALLGSLGGTVSAGYLSRVITACIVVVTLLQSLVITGMFWNAREPIPLAVVLGRETRDEFLTRNLPGYRAVQYLNEHASSGEKVYGIATEQLRFYLNPPMATVAETPSLNQVAARFDGEPLLAELRKRGYAFALLRSSDDVPGRSPFQPWFLDHFSTVEFSDGVFVVHRLGRVAPPEESDFPEEESNLLVNDSFERIAGGMPEGWFSYGNPSLTSRGNVRTGSHAAVARKTGWYAQFVRVSAGRVYTLEHFTRAERDGQNARLQINWVDAAGASVQVDIQAVLAGLQWRPNRMTVTAPAGAAYAFIFASVHEDAEVLFDDFWFGVGTR